MTGQVPHGDRDHSEAPASVPLSEFRQQAGLPPAKDPDQERLDLYAEAILGDKVPGVPVRMLPGRNYEESRRAADAVALSDAEQAELRAEVESLRRWKAEATEVIPGLQDVGKALGLRLGERITGTSAAEAAKRLTERAEKAEAALARVDAEIRQSCAAAIANPAGWGGPMVTSFAHTILRILNEDSAALRDPVGCYRTREQRDRIRKDYDAANCRRRQLQEAWDEGFEAGATWTPSYPSGISCDPPRNPHDEPTAEETWLLRDHEWLRNEIRRAV